MPGEIFDIEVSNVATEMASVEDSSLVFDEDANVKTTHVPGRKGMAYVNFGEDNQLPFNIIKMIGIDEVMSQNKAVQRHHLLRCRTEVHGRRHKTADNPSRNQTLADS